MTEVTYKNSGVDIDAGNHIKKSITDHVKTTFSNNVLKGIGLFSGFFKFEKEKYKNPILVSSIDGVGTKVKVAQMTGKYRSIGEDLVNHCVNDIMVCGADPLFFLDYIAADKLEKNVISEIVAGMATACKESDCALIGGETAEMPQVYAPGNFDIAGTIVGVVEKDQIIDGSKIAPGDVLIGVASNGLHTNGFSLVRKVYFENAGHDLTTYIPGLGSTLGDELLKPHRNYNTLIRQVRNEEVLNGIAHITGGGILGNVSRLLRAQLEVRIDWDSWQISPIFDLIQKRGNISDLEMRKVFNLGIGLVLIAATDNVNRFLEVCRKTGLEAYGIGKVIEK